MSSLAAMAILLGVIAVLCLALVLGQLWAMGGQFEEPVGSFSATRPPPPPPPLVPANFRALIAGEANGWEERPDELQLLTMRLNELEISLGGTAMLAPPLEYMSLQWLDQRIARIEAIAGPLPSPIGPANSPPPLDESGKDNERSNLH